MNKNKKGFTLVELIVVIGILLTLAALGMMALSNIGEQARHAANRSDAEMIARAINTYNALVGPTHRVLLATGANSLAIVLPEPAAGATIATLNLTAGPTVGSPVTIDLGADIDASRRAEIIARLIAPGAGGGPWTVNPNVPVPE